MFAWITPPIRQRLHALDRRLSARSQTLESFFHARLDRILLWWVLFASFVTGLRLAFPATPFHGDQGSMASAWLPYALVVFAPALAIWMGARLFPKGRIFPQPDIRLSRYGRWTAVNAREAHANTLFGTSGLMASLILGLIINIPVRTVEFLMAIPALGSHAPEWFSAIFMLMLADTVLLCALYGFAFMMALRHAPLFPRFLLWVWGVDILAQLGISSLVAGFAETPPEVESALATLLTGNIQKACISAALWLPYLIISDRVNVTFRSRLRV